LQKKDNTKETNDKLKIYVLIKEGDRMNDYNKIEIAALKL
jgi:hypothetical protein